MGNRVKRKLEVHKKWKSRSPNNVSIKSFVGRYNGKNGVRDMKILARVTFFFEAVADVFIYLLLQNLSS